jgi:hypothetical protein
METGNLAIKAIELNEKIHEKNGIKIKGGKTYTKVVHRIEAFRRVVGYEWGIDTEITIGATGALCKAVITDPSGMVKGAGSSFTKSIQSDKGIEKCETTAIGRALASLSLGGDEYASIEEIDSHQERYEEPKVEGVVVQDPEIDANNLTTSLIASVEACKNVNEFEQAKANARKHFNNLDDGQKASLLDAISLAENVFNGGDDE